METTIKTNVLLEWAVRMCRLTGWRLTQQVVPGGIPEAVMDSDSTTSIGRSCHLGIAHGTNTYFNTSVLGLSLINFLEWPCLVLVVLISKNSCHELLFISSHQMAV